MIRSRISMIGLGTVVLGALLTNSGFAADTQSTDSSRITTSSPSTSPPLVVKLVTTTAPSSKAMTQPAENKPVNPRPLSLVELEPKWRKYLDDATRSYGLNEQQQKLAQSALDRCLERAQAAQQQFTQADSEAKKRGDETAKTAAQNAFRQSLRKLDGELYGRIDAVATMEQVQKAASAGFVSPVAQRAPKLPEVGQVAADFTLQDPSGESVTLSQLRGKFVVVHFWASWCGFCKKAMPEIQKIYEANRDRSDVVVLGVNCAQKPTSPDPKDIFKQLGCTYRLLLNGDPLVSLYDVKGYPVLYVIGPDGKIIFKERGAKANQASSVQAVISAATKKA